jgi:hypothetical protein
LLFCFSKLFCKTQTFRKRFLSFPKRSFVKKQFVKVSLEWSTRVRALVNIV